MVCIRRYLKINCQLYGEARTVPKHHVLMHIAMDKDYMDVFSLERMNLLPKKHAVHMCRSKHFESSVQMRILRTRNKQLASMEFTDAITDGTESQILFRLLGSVAVVGMNLRMKTGLQLGADDVIFVGKDCHICCIVKACCKADGRVGLIVDKLASTSK